MRAKDSAGKRLGTAGTNIGNAPLQWACSEAAALFLRDNPAGQQYLARVERTHDQGKALTILAHQLARAVYYMLKRHTAVDRDTFLQGARGRAGEPGASLDTPGIRLSRARPASCWTASVNATVRLGLVSQSPGRCMDPRSGSSTVGASCLQVAWAAPLPSLPRTGAPHRLSQAFD